MTWTAEATGNMTLSVLDDQGFQILKVDMLAAGTMKAGTDGDLLARALNNLQVIANFSVGDYNISDDNLKYPGGGLSPLPWSAQYDCQKRRMVIKSGKKTIADRTFPNNIPEDKIQEVVTCITNGISAINASN